VLDLADNAEAVKAAFQEYYRAMIQEGETDPNKLHDLKSNLDAQQVCSWPQEEDLVAQYLAELSAIGSIRASTHASRSTWKSCPKTTK
jgi:type I site-specific restriction-modification system R (restriction) subunit